VPTLLRGALGAVTLAYAAHLAAADRRAHGALSVGTLAEAALGWPS
jgi:hypothetical protein